MVAIVTGASRGIGQAIARRLAAAGASVVAVGRTLRPNTGRFPGSLEETVALIEQAGGTALAAQADLGDDAQLRALVERAEGHFGRGIQILVNNAAARRHFELTFPLMTRDTFAEAVLINVWAPWQLALCLLPGMRREGAGWIVNISSRAAAPLAGPPFRTMRVGAQSLYGSTKAMLDRLTTGAAMELYADRIAVNALAPALPVLTDNARVEAGLDESIRHEPTETVAEAALALCTCDPTTMTGRVAYSLSLLVELNRPVWTLDGTELLADWQPGMIEQSLLWPGYLVEPRPGR